MRIKGKVVGGRSVALEEELPDGTEVTVVTGDEEVGIDLSPEDAAELDDRIAEIEAGHYIDGEQFLRELRSHK